MEEVVHDEVLEVQVQVQDDRVEVAEVAVDEVLVHDLEDRHDEHDLNLSSDLFLERVEVQKLNLHLNQLP